MKHWWWKIMAALLLLCASIAALWVPLAPDLVHVAPDRIAPGPAGLLITGYNTRFSEGENVFLENAGQRVCPTSVETIDATHLRAHFEVPAGMKDNLTDVCAGPLRYAGALYTEGLGDGIASGPCGAVKTFDLAFRFPNRNILYESIRNLFFHVPMWFAMIALMGISVAHSIRGLSTDALGHDRAALSAVQTGLLFCALGLITGSLWARATWTSFWTNDVKLNGAAVTTLIYLAYLVLRGSVADAHKRTRLAAIYNIFAFVLLVLFLFVVPRLNAVDSLHPGNGGNSPFSDLDLDNRLRMVFYPAVLGWILLAVWMFTLRDRAARLAEQPDR
jgi:heme exporter protein C